MRILPDPILRRQARKVGKVPANMKKFTDDMIETMHAELGVGLAANQIGSLQKVAVIQLPDWKRRWCSSIPRSSGRKEKGKWWKAA
jgi:peptide deformylase